MRDRHFPASTDRYQPEHYDLECDLIEKDLEEKLMGREAKQSVAETRRKGRSPAAGRGKRKRYQPKEKEDYQPTQFVVRDESASAREYYNHKKFVEDEVSNRYQTIHRSHLNVRDSREMSAALRHHTWMGEGYF